MKLKLVALPLVLGTMAILGACADPQTETPDATTEETMEEPMAEPDATTEPMTEPDATEEPMTEPEGE